MGNKHMRRSLRLQAVREMKIKTTLRFRMAVVSIKSGMGALPTIK